MDDDIIRDFVKLRPWHPDSGVPHDCEDTITRIDNHLKRYADRLNGQDRIALNEAAVVLKRIADEDRAQAAERGTVDPRYAWPQ